MECLGHEGPAGWVEGEGVGDAAVAVRRGEAYADKAVLRPEIVEFKGDFQHFFHTRDQRRRQSMRLLGFHRWESRFGGRRVGTRGFGSSTGFSRLCAGLRLWWSLESSFAGTASS